MSEGGGTTARILALAIPGALIAGALGSQYLGGLYPCEMCQWQRWPHYAAMLVALGAFIVPAAAMQRVLVLIATVLIAISGVIGVLHAGVEYGWWEGFTACTARIQPGGGDFLDALLKAPIVRCDVAQWTLAGISLAGFNAIFSLGGAIAILVALGRRRG